MTSEDLKVLITDKLEGGYFVVVSNREPYVHAYQGNEIKCLRPASGLVTALNPVMQTCRGLWVAHGSGSADRDVVDASGKIMVPPEAPSYALKRVWLSKSEEEGYYYGFSNQSLWPLCHVVFIRPLFNYNNWLRYKEVNEKFAAAILEEIQGKKALVWIQDYHLALVPKIIKQSRPDVKIAQFWHIPWPAPEVFRTCPWLHDILEGMLGNDLIGFHLRSYCDNFLGTVALVMEARIDREHSAVFYSGTFKRNRTLVQPFPISVDYDRINLDAQNPVMDKTLEELKALHNLEGKVVALGLDRLDYTKGIPERLKAIDRFLEKYPQYQEKFVFLEAGALSRIFIETYKDLNDEITRLATQINWKYTSKDWQPVILMKRHVPYEELIGYYRLADLLIVSSLHDGMNLVAKEFISAKVDLSGALMLSNFTGAAQELEGAFTFNPFNIEDFADRIKTVLETDVTHKKQRMKKLRNEVKENNIYKWAFDAISAHIKLS